MNINWSKGRIAYLVVGIICVAVGLAFIIPALVN